ncbi:predicted protein [Chaetoceros tenuissimus]|uniref:MYND-type domain-containing protein n=1 Tax=Chaetoceros tenuissimus TaxID=426638 RepID=A0AAD3H1S1_9STRA|nr:predicted protein [Chaetoceros tenuissimus]
MMSPHENEEQPQKNVEANESEHSCSEILIKLRVRNQELQSIIEKKDSLAVLPASIGGIIQECILNIFSMYQEALRVSDAQSTSLSEEQDINLDKESSNIYVQGQQVQKLHEKLAHHYDTFTRKSSNDDLNTGGSSLSSALDKPIRASNEIQDRIKVILECYEKSFAEIEKSVCKFLHGLNDKSTLSELESIFSIFPKSFQQECRGEMPIQSCVQSIKSVKWLPELLKCTFPNQDENEKKQILNEIRIFGSKAILDVKCLKLGENGIMRRFHPTKMQELTKEDLSYTLLEYLFVSKPILFDADETFIATHEMDYDNVYVGVIQDLYEKEYVSRNDLQRIFSSIGGVMSRDKERRYGRRIKFLWNTVRIKHHENETTFNDLLEVSTLTANGNADWLQKSIENPNKIYRMYKMRERRRREMNSSLSKAKLPKQKKPKMLDNVSPNSANAMDVSELTKLSPAKSSTSNKVSRPQCSRSQCTNIRNLRKCLGCNIAKYCSQKCQVDDWIFHQQFCVGKQDATKGSSEAGNIHKDSNQKVSNITPLDEGTQIEKRTTDNASAIHSKSKAVSTHNTSRVHSTLASNNGTGKTMPSKAANKVSLSQKQQSQQKSMNGTTFSAAHMNSNTRIGQHQPSVVGTNIMKSTIQCSYPPCQIVNGLMKCGGCNIASYCSRNCQTSHWPMHQKTCLLRQHEARRNNASTQQLQQTQTKTQIPTQQQNSLQRSYPQYHQQHQRPYQQPVQPYQNWNMQQQQHFVSNTSLHRSYQQQQQWRQSIPLNTNNGIQLPDNHTRTVQRTSRTHLNKGVNSKTTSNTKKAPNNKRASNEAPLKRKSSTESESIQKKSRLETNETSSLVGNRKTTNQTQSDLLSITRSTFSDIDLTKYGKYFSYIGDFILKDFIDEETNESSTFRGQIEYIYMGHASADSKKKELLFHVQYSDGDTEDLTLDEVQDFKNDYNTRGDCTQNNDNVENDLIENEDSKDVEVDQDLFQAIQTATKVAVDKRKSLSKANKENQPSNIDIPALPRTETWEDEDDDEDEVDNENNGEGSNVYFDYSDLSQDEDDSQEDDDGVVAPNVYDDEGVSDYNDDGGNESEEESFT